MLHLLLFGSSIFLAGVCAQLNTDPAVQVQCCTSLDKLGSLSQFSAAVIDLHDPSSRDVLPLLRARPDMRIICLNSTAGTLIDLTGQVYFTPTLQDIIRRITNPPAQ